MNEAFSKALRFALITALISGFAVFINKFGVKLWDDSSAYTTAKNIVAAVFLAGLIMTSGRFAELKTLSEKTWAKLALIGLVGGSVPFLLFFKSLTLIPAAEAAFIHKTLFLWVALFSYPVLKERLSKIQLLALAVLGLAVFLSGAPSKWDFGIGALLALAATLLWAIENIIAKIVLRDLSATTVAWARMTLGSFFLLAYLLATGNIAHVVPTSLAQMGWALAVGLILFGYVSFWYAALKGAPATIVTAILVIAAPITSSLEAIFVTHTFPSKIVIPMLFMTVAVALLARELRRTPAPQDIQGASVRA